MRLTREAEIAIGLLVACARAPGGLVQTQTAATALGISRNHAAKIAHRLMVAGLVATTRGRSGGLGLAQPADTIPLSDVLRLMQPDALEIVPAGTRGPHFARLDAIVGAARSGFIALMRGVTIADLAMEAAAGRLACLDCRFLHTAHGTTPSIPHHRCPERPSHASVPHG